MLNALAIGPNVPAVNGKAVEANHHRLRLSVSSSGSKIVGKGIPWIQEIGFLFLLLLLIMLVWVPLQVLRDLFHGFVQARVVHG